MKFNRDKDFWKYVQVNNGVIESYNINGVFRGKWASAQYLIEKYKITDQEAYEYINSMRHL